MSKGITRRSFLGVGTLGATGVALAGLGLVGCTPQKTSKADSAKATSKDEVEAVAIDESSIGSTKTYDIVVVGGCSAGLSATAAAAEEGASVICLEKTSKPAGAGTYYGFINTDLLTRNGVEPVDEDKYARDLIEAALGATNPKLVRTFVGNSASVGNWLEGVAKAADSELKFSNAMGSENTACFDDDTPGKSAYDTLTKYASSKGAEFAYESEAVQLDKDDSGRIVSVVVRNGDGTYTRYAANKGVVLATGGFNGNSAMMDKYIPWVDQETLAIMSPIHATGNTGDGITMSKAVGATIPKAPMCPMIHFIQGAMPVAGTLYVNGAGRRFMDEGTSMEVAAQIVMRQPGHTMYQISDAKPSGMALMMQTTGDASASDSASAGGHGPSSGMANDNSPTFDTLEELAASLDMDPDVLTSTVNRFNELVAKGTDEDFNSDFSIAVSIDTPPFKAVEAPPCMLAAMGGPQIDETMAVLDENYAPIPGLYATGNCAGGFYGPNYPMQVQSGLARAFSVVSGYLASKNALASA